MKFDSFVRQLQNYGFVKERNIPDAYSNPKLKGSNIDDVLNLVRVHAFQKRAREDQGDAGDQRRLRRKTRGRPPCPVNVRHKLDGTWSAWVMFESRTKATAEFKNRRPKLTLNDIRNMLNEEFNSVDQPVRDNYQVELPGAGGNEAAPGAMTCDGDEPAAESLDDTSAPEQPGTSRQSSLTTPGAKLFRPGYGSSDFKEYFPNAKERDGDKRIRLLVRVSNDVTAVKLICKADGEEAKYMECHKGADEWYNTGEDRESIIRFCVEDLTLKQYNFTIETQSNTDADDGQWAPQNYGDAKYRRNSRTNRVRAPPSNDNDDDDDDDDDDDYDDEEMDGGMEGAVMAAAEEQKQDDDSDYDRGDPEAEEDEPGTLNMLELTFPNSRRMSFDNMWDWIDDIIKKSHGLRSRVHKGNFFEQVSKAIFEKIFENSKSVEIVAANTTGKQGDDGRDIEVLFEKGTGMGTKIADCKNFGGKQPASRPHVRSVIGSMMTHPKIVAAKWGTGILLTNTCFTKPAMQCAEEFNNLHIGADRNGLKVELWDLKKLKQKLRQHVPDDEDEVTEVQKLFWNIQDNLETANLVTFI